MKLRKKLLFGLIGLVVLVVVMVLSWGVKTGKIKLHADTIPLTGTGTISGKVTAWPSGTCTMSLVEIIRLNNATRESDSRVVKSDQRSYSFQKLPVGDYIIQLSGCRYDSVGPIHLATNQTVTMDLTPQTSFKGLIVLMNHDAQGNTTGAQSLAGAQVTLGVCTANCYTGTPTISRTFTPVTSVLDSRGFSYITSGEVNTFLPSEKDEMTIGAQPPWNQLVAISISKSGITTPLKGYFNPVPFWTGNGTWSKTIFADVKTEEKNTKSPGIVNFAPFCTGN